MQKKDIGVKKDSSFESDEEIAELIRQYASVLAPYRNGLKEETVEFLKRYTETYSESYENIETEPLAIQALNIFSAAMNTGLLADTAAEFKENVALHIELAEGVPEQ
jgi:hypothetical protein